MSPHVADNLKSRTVVPGAALVHIKEIKNMVDILVRYIMPMIMIATIVYALLIRPTRTNGKDHAD